MTRSSMEPEGLSWSVWNWDLDLGVLDFGRHFFLPSTPPLMAILPEWHLAPWINTARYTDI